jgi:hypothetical protein
MQMQLEVDPSGGLVDVLVVVDNSMSMAEEQDMLARAFPHLVRSLLDPARDPATGLRRHLPVSSLHLGVVSTDMGTGGYSVETCSDPIDGDNGELQHTPNPHVEGCDETYTPYLESRWERTPSSVEWMSTAFGCIARLGIDGCGFEQQLKAAVKALIDHRDGANAGFLRRGSTLAVVLLTDELDCSVEPGGEGIFDTLDSSLGHLGLRCFHHPYMIQPVEDYIEWFGSLRETHAHVLLGFIIGVPLGEECEGRGDRIPGCLDHPRMQEEVDPVSMTRLIPSCTTRTGEAYPPRRMVQIAQAFGPDALVSSICTDDLLPAVVEITDLVHSRIDGTPDLVSLPVEKDPLDPGLCRASCTAFEPLDPETPIPRVATRLSDPSLACDDPRAVHVPGDGAGWVYVPNTPAGPRIFLAGGFDLAPGSTMELSCCF